MRYNSIVVKGQKKTSTGFHNEFSFSSAKESSSNKCSMALLFFCTSVLKFHS